MYIDDSGRIYDCRPVNRTDDSQNRLSLSQDNGIVDFSSAADSTIPENNKKLCWVLSMAMCIGIWAFINFATDGCDGDPILAIGTLIGAIVATLLYCGSMVREYNLKSACVGGASAIVGMIASVAIIIIIAFVIAVVMALITFFIAIGLSMLLIGLFSGS